MQFLEYIEELNTVSIVVRLLMSVIFGGFIGMERGQRRQAAGFRTHILVCLGSTLAMVTNIFIVHEYSLGGDPTRIAAQVISGIGFLGVGTIIVTGNKQIKGLTTAAGLWASACMGIAIGAGFYLAAIIAFLIIVVVMTLLNNVDRWFYQHSRMIELYIEFNEIQAVSGFLLYTRDSQIKSTNLQLTKSKVIGENAVSVLVTLTCPKRRDHAELLGELGEISGINFIEEL